jgi:vancomycin resistance protein YoaR
MGKFAVRRSRVSENRRRRSGRKEESPAWEQRGDQDAQPRYAAFPRDEEAPLPYQPEEISPDEAPLRPEQPVPGDANWHARPAPYILQPQPRLVAQQGWVQEVPLNTNRVSGLHLAIFIVCLVLLAAMGFFVLTVGQAQDEFNQKLAFMQRETFFDGVSVDGLPLGGLRQDEAAQKLQQSVTLLDEKLDLQVQVDGKNYQVPADQIPFSRNSRAQLAAAWALGRQGFAWGIGSDKTPFDIRWEHTRHIAASKPDYRTASTYDKADVRRVADLIASQVDREPIIAIIASFDFDTKTFTVTQDVPGAKLDSQALYQAVCDALDAGKRNETIRLDAMPILPQVTSVELQNGFKRLSQFSTDTTSDEKRNTNILLAARKISGSTVMPGETFSFNKATGERSADKGYQMAPAVAGGVTFDEIGGGVCQVSSTLFNAAALADMSIVSRSPHAWPSNYVDKGLDATVNWPGLDFVFRNDKATPIFIVAGYAKRQVTVEIYGMSTGSGESLRLETELTSEIPPPREPSYVQNPLLVPGTQKELKKARTGYSVDTFRVYLLNGVPYRRDKLFTSTYPMVQTVIEYN